MGYQISELFKALCQIVLLAVPLYYLLKFLRRTRGFPILAGLLVIILVLWGVTSVFDLEVIDWILTHGATWLPLVLVIIFQPELRRIFASIATHSQAPMRGDQAASVVSQLAIAIDMLAEERHGAILAVERNESLAPFTTGGRWLDAPVNSELLVSIFYPGTALHDGGVIIRRDRIAWAGCVFPLAMDENRRAFGTRHRAAIGLSDRTDAAVIVVSEESGLVSVAYRGEILRGVNHNSLVQILRAVFEQAPEAEADSKKPADLVANAIASAKEDF